MRKLVKVIKSVMSPMGPTVLLMIPSKTPTITFAIPNAPKLIAAAAIEAPMTAAETGLEQENTNPVIRAGARKRL